MELGMLAVALLMGFAILGAAIGQGLVGSKAMEAMARQPEIAGQVRITMILALALIEALAIYGLLIAFMMLGKI